MCKKLEANMDKDIRRLFFGLEIKAPWPSLLPTGRLLTESNRHLTLAFLGETDFEQLKTILPTIPHPSFNLGFGGFFDHCLILPPKHPTVVAWHIKWLEEVDSLLNFRHQLVTWLQEHQFSIAHANRDFLPHVTLCRHPFKQEEWKQAFTPLPLFISHFHLYQSLGNSQYQSIWHIPISPPFEEIEHTADIAFHINGYSFKQLHQHAQLALAFHYPLLLNYLSPVKEEETIEEIVMALNEMIALVDTEIGCPFKAISFHDTITQEQNLLTWEMIVDV